MGSSSVLRSIIPLEKIKAELTRQIEEDLADID
jgi:hypothetical protein